MKKANNFFKTEERASGAIFRNKVPIEKLGDSTLKIKEDLFDITTSL